VPDTDAALDVLGAATSPSGMVRYRKFRRYLNWGSRQRIEKYRYELSHLSHLAKSPLA